MTSKSQPPKPLAPRELVPEILSLAFSRKMAPKKPPQNVSILVGPLLPLPITKKTVKEVADAIREGTPEVEVLKSISFEFPYNRVLVKLLYDEPSADNEGMEFEACIAMFLYLSWTMAGKDVMHDNVTFHLLSVIARCYHHCENAKLRRIACECFRQMYLHNLKFVYEDGSFGPFLEMYESMVTSLEPEFAVGYFDIVYRLAAIYVDTTEHAFTVDGTRFLETLTSIMAKLRKRLPQDVIEGILPSTCSAFNELHPQACVLAVLIADVYGVEVISPYLPMIPLSVLRLIEAEEPKNPVAVLDDENPLLLDEKTDVKLKNVMVDYQTMDEGFVVKRNLLFPMRIPLEKLIRENLLTKISAMMTTFVTNVTLAKTIVNLCCSYFKDELHKKEYILDTFAVFLFMLREVRKKVRFSAPMEIVSHKQLFDPKATLFHQPPDWQVLSSLRSYAVELVTSSGMRMVATIFHKFVRTPYLFAEVVYRVLPKNTDIKVNVNDIGGVAQTIFMPMGYYQSFSGMDAQTREAISTARISLFVFLEALLKRDDAFLQFMENTTFVEYYFALIYEPPVKPLVIETFKRYLAIGSCYSGIGVGERILRLLADIAHHFDEEPYVRLEHELLTLLIGKIEGDNELGVAFEPAIGPIAKNLFLLKISEATIQFFELFCKFFVFTSKFHKMEWNEVSAVTAMAQRIWKDDPPESFYLEVVKWAAGSSSATPETPFDLCQPRALSILFHAFSNSQYLAAIFQFVQNLCDFNEANSKLIHDNEIDTDLLGIIEKCRTNECVDLDIIDKTFELFTFISVSASSVSSVQQFISLMCPIEGKFLPTFHLSTLNTLYELLLNRENQQIVIPFDKSAIFHVRGLTSDCFMNGFTYFFSILRCQTGSESYLKPFQIMDTKKQRISIIITSSSFVVEIAVPGGANKRYQTPMKLNNDEWSLIACSFEPCQFSEEGNEWKITVYKNESQYPEVMIHMFQFNEGRMRAQIGGVSNENKTTHKRSSFNVVALFPLLPHEDITCLCQGGEISEHLVKKACFWFSPVAARESISLKNILLDSPVSCLGGIRSNANMSFADTLVELCGIDMLLPLFAQWRLTFLNGEQPEDLPLLTMEIFKTAILISNDGQKQFCDKDGFTIMSYLIQQNPDEILTFELYSYFVDIFRALTYEKLKQQLLVAILTNEGILKRCPPPQRVAFYRHWKQQLFPENIDLVVSVRKFTWILNAAITFSLESASEGGYYPENDEIKSLMTDIAIMIGLREMRDIDVYDLIVSIVTADNEALILYLLNIFSRIAVRKESPIHHLNQAKAYLPSLMVLMQNPSEDVNMAALQVMIDCSRTGLFDDVSPTTVVDTILHHVRSDFVTGSRFGLLMDHIIKGDQFMFPICSWVAMNLGAEFVEKMYTVLLPGPQFATFKYWSVWSIASLFKAENEQVKQILEFLVKCSIKPPNENHYEWLVAGMKVIGKATEASTHSLCNSALWEYTKALLAEAPTEEEMIIYFKHLRFFLFYHCHVNCDEALDAAYNESPFVEAGRTRQRTGRRTTRRRNSRHSISSLLLDTNEVETGSVLAIAPQPSITSSPSPTRRGRARIGARRSSIFSVAEIGAIRESLEMPSALVAPPVNVTFAGEIDKAVIDLGKKEIIYHFGIRREYDGSWKDMDFAKTGIKLFLKYPYDDLIPTTLTIAAFVLHYDPELAESVACRIRGIDDPKWLDAIAFYDYHAVKTGNPTIGSGMTREELARRHSDFIVSFISKEDKSMCAMSLRYIKHFMKFQSATRNFAKRCEVNMTKLESDATNIQAEYMEEIGRFYTESSRKWNHFLRCVTTDRAPWRHSLPSSFVRESHFKRDFTVCSDFVCPKIKLNMRFDNHMVASQIRDNGLSLSTSESLNEDLTRDSKVNETSEKLRKQYMNHGTFSLFELAEEVPMEKAGVESALSISDCIVELPCEIIKKGTAIEATFALMSDVLVLSRSEKRVTVIRLNCVTAIYLRSRFHHRTAIEIFTNDGRSYFINFPNVRADSVLKSFKRIRMTDCPFTIQSLDFKAAFEAEKWTEKWQNRKISNFQYLMHLNFGSGRSVHDYSQYPVFPWVLSDYTSEQLDLSNPNVFRDLKKPIGAINDERLGEIMEKVEQLRESGMYPYMYSAGYSCPLSVCLFMVRLEPFTSMHIEIQGGKFDHAARLFSSIKEAFRLVSTTHNDYRELIPEFFCMPEFLVNRDNFDLGSVDGQKIGDVELPAWAKTPMEFIYLHRKALESEYVSASLNHWIDLIWGEKQSGEKATAAHNVFIREIYPDIWDHVDLNDPKARAQTEALLCHVGQIPPQLFDKPHPMRNARKKVTLYPRRKHEVLSKEPISEAFIQITDSQLVKAYYMTEDFKVGVGEYKIGSLMATPAPSIPKKVTKEGRTASITGAPPSDRVVSDSSFPNLAKHSSTRDGSMSRLAAVFETMNVSFSGDGFNIVQTKPNELMTAKTDGIHLRIKHNSQILLSAADGPWTLIADRDSSFSLYRNNVLKFSIPLFTSSVKSACVNSKFNMAVCGTHDCSLMFCSLSNGYVTRCVKITRTPDLVLCTPSWGFVCVHSIRFDEGRSRYFLCLYTANGDLIREREIEEAITVWNTFSTPDGFDYIILGTEGMKCYVFEAFYLELGKPFYNSKSLLAAIQYSTGTNVAVLVTIDGIIEFLPLALE